MGVGGISIGKLLIILLIIVMIFGTKRLRDIGGDLGNAVKSFKKAINNNEDEAADSASDQTTDLKKQSENDKSEQDKS